jgi:hypothetical protein
MKKNKVLFLIISLIVLVSLSGCIPGDGTSTVTNPANFLWGIWHGWLAPLTLIISIFDKNIHMYEVANSGFWYDLGYYMAIISGFGGLSFYRKKHRN